MNFVRRFMTTLERSERTRPAELRKRQMETLADVARHARAHVAAYHERLDAAFTADGRFQPSSWSRVPVLRRKELIDGGQAFFAHNLPPHLKPLKWSATSGTTGQPILYAKTPLATIVSGCVNERLMAWHSLDSAAPMAFIYYCKPGEADFPEGRSTTSVSPLGVPALHHWLSNRATIDQMVDWLKRRNPAYLTVYPSIADEIARRLDSDGVRLPIRAVLTYGEALLDEQRQHIEQGLGPVVDAYSANEIGFIALQCPQSDAYHIPTETILVEVADENGQPVPEGEAGEILLTPFFNTVMPLIRYQIGDLGAFAKGPCPCGVRLPRLRSIHGRSRELFTYSSGERRFPALSIGDLQACLPLDQFQIVQHTPTQIEIVYVPRHDAGPPDLEALQALARRDLAPDVTVSATPVAAIPRSPAGKLQRTISHVR